MMNKRQKRDRSPEDADWRDLVLFTLLIICLVAAAPMVRAWASGGW